jgi:hypothetical protein
MLTPDKSGITAGWRARAGGFLAYYLHPGRRDTWGGPFNGQQSRQQLFRDLVAAVDFRTIVETGTHRGSTTAFLRRTSRAVVHTTEVAPRLQGYCHARFLFDPRVRVHACDSRKLLADLLPRLARDSSPVFFYLDAHWQEDLPLREECALILRHRVPAVIMIDDFEVPGDPGYGCDDYGANRRLCLDYLSPLTGWSAFFPTCPAGQETGARRGCVVLATTPAITDRLRQLPALAHAISPRRRLVIPGPPC